MQLYKVPALVPVLLFSLITLCAPYSMAQSADPSLLSPPEIYLRCYTKLTRTIPAANDTLLTQVKAGTLSATDACMRILNSAAFNNEGKISSTTNQTSRNVLETLHLVHKNWFKSPLFAHGGGGDFLIHDPEEPALYYTRALFGASVRADSVLKYNKSVRALRDRPMQDSTNVLTHFQARRFFDYPKDSPADGLAANLVLAYGRNATVVDGVSKLNTLVVPDTSIIQLGRLIGITEAPSLVIPEVNSITLNGAKIANKTATEIEIQENSAMKAASLNVDLRAHLGGGVIGSLTFLEQNTGANLNALNSGYDIIDRRFASRVFEDLLCHQLPTLEESDVGAPVTLASASQPITNVVTDSVHLYQTQKSCMQCHATIDTMAFANSRLNFVRGFSTGTVLKQPGMNPLGVLQLPVITGSSLTAFKNNPTLLYFRSVAQESGSTRVKINITSARPHEQIGNELAKYPDFYTCMAKRYYEYFTGIKVPMAADPEQTELDRYHRKLVLDLGLQLKNDSAQSVRNMLKSLFASAPFIHRNFQAQSISTEREN